MLLNQILESRRGGLVNPKDDSVDADAARFRSTHWSVVLTAAQGQTPAGQAALADLYRAYWYPLYSHVRRRGHNPHEAQDLTQGFFLHLLERRGLTQVDPHKGRFRSFLLASLQNFFRFRGTGSAESSVADSVSSSPWTPRR